MPISQSEYAMLSSDITAMIFKTFERKLDKFVQKAGFYGFVYAKKIVQQKAPW